MYHLITREVETSVKIRHLHALRGTCDCALVSRADMMRQYRIMSYRILMRTCSLLAQSTAVRANQLETNCCCCAQKYKRVRARLWHRRRREREFLRLALRLLFSFGPQVCKHAVQIIVLEVLVRYTPIPGMFTSNTGRSTYAIFVTTAVCTIFLDIAYSVIGLSFFRNLRIYS